MFEKLQLHACIEHLRDRRNPAKRPNKSADLRRAIGRVSGKLLRKGQELRIGQQPVAPAQQKLGSATMQAVLAPSRGRRRRFAGRAPRARRSRECCRPRGRARFSKCCMAPSKPSVGHHVRQARGPASWPVGLPISPDMPATSRRSSATWKASPISMPELLPRRRVTSGGDRASHGAGGKQARRFWRAGSWHEVHAVFAFPSLPGADAARAHQRMRR